MNCIICTRALLGFETDTRICSCCTAWVERGAATNPRHSPRQQYWIARVSATTNPRDRAATLARAKRDLAAARTTPPPRLVA